MNAAFFPAKTAPQAPTAGPPAQSAPVQTATIDPDVRPGVKPQPAPRRIDPKSLVGKNQGDIRDLLGTPTTIQTAAPATIWRYTANGCALDVFFYMDLGTNTLRALTYDATAANAAASEETTATCVGQIQSANRVSNR